MNIMDGKKIADAMIHDLRISVANATKPLRLAIVVVGEDPVVRRFIAQKKAYAESIGVDVRIYPFEKTITTNQLRKHLSDIVRAKENHGVIIQLPLPEHIGKQYILDAITLEKDVDMLSARAIGKMSVGKSSILPPVAGAVKAFFEEYSIDYTAANIVLLGAGVLVGQPVARWLLSEGATLTVVRMSTKDPDYFIRNADIVISGLGHPGYITKNMIKKGVVLIDAGTSESNGKLVGDVDTISVKDTAGFLTPVPGGVGPLTVAILFQNLITLASK
jgi:methylenetetrahydrofolate dehydrogenase (NADP+) / methenyltetrahydrofolate cyclohydrolase